MSVVKTTSPLTVKLPEEFDTNQVYTITSPSGATYQLIYDDINEHGWTVLPF